MLKEIQSGFSKFFTTERIIMFAALFVLGFMLYSYGNNKFGVMDSMSNYAMQTSSSNITQGEDEKNLDSAEPSANESSTNGASNVASPEDLLPTDANSQWSALNPSSVDKTKGVAAPDLLQSGYHIGTESQCLRNANQQLRPDPVIAKQDIGPWNQSTIDCGDNTRKPLDIGA